MPRAGQEGTWLNTDMISAYKCLHGLGFAHSVEAWADEDLVGGLYGIWLGKAFFGESMFHARPEASRAALAGLVNYLAAQRLQIHRLPAGYAPHVENGRGSDSPRQFPENARGRH